MSGDKDGRHCKHIDLNTSYQTLTQVYSRDEHVHIIKSRTLDFLNSLQDNVLDAVYIDADHSYKGCQTDLEGSRPKVKPGGYILGHDYCKGSPV